MAPQFSQTRRPDMRSTIFSSGDFNVDDLVDDNAHVVQRLGLRDGAGEAVQNKAVFAVVLRQTLLDDADDDLIGDQLALRPYRTWPLSPSQCRFSALRG